MPALNSDTYNPGYTPNPPTPPPAIPPQVVNGVPQTDLPHPPVNYIWH